ncbi:dNTP triphosphohydrolase [candidate division KSB1 bacterium]|nr:dNTP triphosphohydrolase [candidate division KSB1 bacterium]
MIRYRKDLEFFEEQMLSPFAAKSHEWVDTRKYPEDQHDYRTAFQRDRDRIIHSTAFRRLKHKRQVFLTHVGDHYRTRLTHTLEVSQLSRTMARVLGLNEDLAEAIALGHDLGHTPFGHIGEVVLHRIMTGKDDLEGRLKQDVGGFKHNYQSVRVVDHLEMKYERSGLNLTAAVREGLLKHTRLARNDLNYPDFQIGGLNYELDHATTLEGQIVAICDEIAQRTHDLEDGLRAGYVALKDLCKIDLVKVVIKHTKDLDFQSENIYLVRSRLINRMVHILMTDVIRSGAERIEKFKKKTGRTRVFDERLIWFSAELDPLQDALDRFINQKIIRLASKDRSDARAVRTIQSLFIAIFDRPQMLPWYRLDPLLNSDERSSKELDPDAMQRLQTNPRFIRTVCDYIAGMTDTFAEKQLDLLRQKRMSPTELPDETGI